MHSRCGFHTVVLQPAVRRLRCDDDIFLLTTTWLPCEPARTTLFCCRCGCGFFSGGTDEAGMRKYISPRSSSESGDTMRILRTATPWEHGLLRTWFGLAARISPAATGRPYSSMRPLRWTILIRSSAPQGRTQARQHLRLLPIGICFDLSFSLYSSILS
uniref:Uncharacterized protein n=1 Tax=Zea mays TaxID=4577 RepID=C4IZQ3_MAIZE|nr:unknown [Zea mays]